MGEPKNVEVIMRIDFLASNGKEIVCHADKVGELVRCKDCDNWNTWDEAGKKALGNFVCSCAYWTSEDGPVHYTEPEDYCSHGERREDAEIY